MATHVVDLVTVCDLHDPPPALASVSLSELELASLRRARSGRRRREIDVTRRLLRFGLRNALSCSDAPLAWNGRGPDYDDGVHKIGLSISHSRRFAAAALSLAGAVGVDVECPSPARPWRRIVDALFCDADRHWILAAGREGQDPAGRFLAVWTAREAFAKFRKESVLDRLARPLLAYEATHENTGAAGTPRERPQVAVYSCASWTLAVCGIGAGMPRWFLRKPSGTHAAHRSPICFRTLE